MKDYNIFYLPFWYSKQTRFRTIARLSSWIIIYVVPVSLSFLFVSPEFNYINLFKSLLGILLVYNLYEIGYIYNDAETIKKEISPTLRLDYQQLQFYENNKYNIYCFRFLVALIITLALSFYEKTLVFLLSSWAIIPAYALYNSVRSRLNIPLHFILVTLRYCSPVLLFTGLNDSYIIIFMILLFPLINTLERCAESRFNFDFFKGFFLTNKKSGRYVYYFILLATGLSCCYVFGDYVFYAFSCYAFYYMIFRLLSAQVNLNE
ncbi:hypothetical protein ACJ9N4_03355 [Enterobacter sp. LM3]|uniref:hypothetical protein n=1 Tax=Enterobacter sp. LM3 TaxID=3384450 RepID=UPI00398571D4